MSCAHMDALKYSRNPSIQLLLQDPIGLGIMDDPVFVADGTTYERRCGLHTVCMHDRTGKCPMISCLHIPLMTNRNTT